MKELLTIKEVAQKLKLSERTIRSYVERKVIPYIKLQGGSIRFPKDKLDEWLEDSYNAPLEQADKALAENSD